MARKPKIATPPKPAAWPDDSGYASGASSLTADSVDLSETTQPDKLPRDPALHAVVERCVFLDHPDFRAWLKHHLANAEEVLKLGPDGQGWKFNETKRPAALAIRDGLAALLAE